MNQPQTYMGQVFMLMDESLELCLHTQIPSCIVFGVNIAHQLENPKLMTIEYFVSFPHPQLDEFT